MSFGGIPVAPAHPGDSSRMERFSEQCVTNLSVHIDEALAPGLSLKLLLLGNLGKDKFLIWEFC